MRAKSLVAAGLVGLMACAAVTAAGKALLLRYKYKPGAVDKYVMKGGFTTSLVREGATHQVGEKATLDAKLTVKTTAVNAAGAASQELSVDRMEMTARGTKIVVEHGKATILVNGKPLKTPPKQYEKMLGEPVKVQVDSRGAVVKSAAAASRGPSSAFDPAQFQHMTVVFPQGAVAPGQKWSGSIKLPAGSELPRSLDFTYRFVGTERYKGTQVARINVSGAGKLQGATGGKAPVESVKQNLNGYELFDYKAGRVSYIKWKVQQVVTRAAGEKQQPVTAIMNGEIEVARQ